MNYIQPKSLAGATFFLSTGRCGTQWICKSLADLYKNEAIIQHEPIQANYWPRKYLRAENPDDLLSEKTVAEHIARINEVLCHGKIYIETGWPCYAAAELFISKFTRQVSFVHVVRNPVEVALSLATHNVYNRQDWIAKAAICPYDDGVIQKGLAQTWNRTTQYEKTLFWWTEINLYIEDLKKANPGIQFHFLKYEDLFGASDKGLLKELIEFMGLDYSWSIKQRQKTIVDGFRMRTQPVDWKLVFKYPVTCSLANKFGYNLDELSASELSERYYL